MDVCFEPEYSTEPPDIVKDPEHTPTRKPLIEPVTATIYDKRKQGQQLSRGRTKGPLVTSGSSETLNLTTSAAPTSHLEWYWKPLAILLRGLDSANDKLGKALLT